MILAAASGLPMPSASWGQRTAATPKPRVRSTTSTRPCPACGDRRELVHDQQHPLRARFAADGPLGELLDQEAGEVAGLVLEPQPVEQEVGAVDLVEARAAVEGAGDGGEEGGVAGADPVQLLLAERGDLGERERAFRVQARAARSRWRRREQLGGAAWRPARGVAGEPDGVDGEVAVVGAAALVRRSRSAAGAGRRSPRRVPRQPS